MAPCASENNVSDILTRQPLMPASELPWANHSMEINEECLHTNIIPIPSLPDSDKKNILANVAVTPGAGSNVSTVQPVGISPEGAPNLVTVMLCTT